VTSPRLVNQAFGLAQMPDINKKQNGIISQITSEKLVCQGFGTYGIQFHMIDKVRSSRYDYILERVQLCLMLIIKGAKYAQSTKNTGKNAARADK
jgi:hypothetical protein